MGRGLVQIKLLGDLPTGSGQLGGARLAARYLGTYVTKDAYHGWEGLHRYEVAHGAQPARVSINTRAPTTTGSLCLVGGELS